MHKSGRYRIGQQRQKKSKNSLEAAADRGGVNNSEENSPILEFSLTKKLAMLRSGIGLSSDFSIRELGQLEDGSRGIAFCHFDGLVDQNLLNDLIARISRDILMDSSLFKKIPDVLKTYMPTGGLSVAKTEKSLIQAILDGKCAVLIDGLSDVYAVSLPGGERRGVEEPTSQTVVRGPKEGFTEDVSTNISLIRRKIRTADLRFEDRYIGKLTQTRVSVAYIEGIANPKVIQEAFARLDAIDTDSILESGYIEEFIQDGSHSPFPTLMNTERPDAVAGSLLEGQIAILVDGSPFVLIAPVTFFKFFSSSEDYYQGFQIASFLRLVRLFSFFVAMLLPSIYIAVTTFQQEMIPTTLLISLAAQREGTPLPALLEALLMELTFEVIREAGVRMPRVVGPAISIVGALVLGQAAVQAGLVSAAMVIIVSFTAISSFVIPVISMSSAVRLIRFALMFLAGSFGLYGILAGLIPIVIHMISLSSFGVPYLLPASPVSISNLKDAFVRIPWRYMNKRPAYISVKNKQRQSPSAKGGSKK